MVAAATPFDANGQLDLTTVSNYVSYLIRIGVRGAYVHGTTGEGVSISLTEKQALTKAWVDANAIHGQNRMLLIINVSSPVISESRQMAQFCSKLTGVDGIATLPSFYYRPSNAESMVSHLEDVGNSAQSLPLMLYHFPMMTNVSRE